MIMKNFTEQYSVINVTENPYYKLKA